MSLETAKKYIVLGAGGHANVALSLALELGLSVQGLLDRDSQKHGKSILGCRVLGDDSWLDTVHPSSIILINGIGSVHLPQVRMAVFKKFLDRGFSFQALIHPKASVAQGVKIESGTLVMAGAIVQTGVQIGKNCIINSGAIVDHDTQIGDHVHISPGAVVCGFCTVGSQSHIGAGATLIDHISIGDRCVVGAGATVVKSFPPLSLLMGVPAHRTEISENL